MVLQIEDSESEYVKQKQYLDWLDKKVEICNEIEVKCITHPRSSHKSMVGKTKECVYVQMLWKRLDGIK